MPFYRVLYTGVELNTSEPLTRFVAATSQDNAVAAVVSDALASGITAQIQGIEEVQGDIVIGS